MLAEIQDRLLSARVARHTVQQDRFLTPFWVAVSSATNKYKQISRAGVQRCSDVFSPLVETRGSDPLSYIFVILYRKRSLQISHFHDNLSSTSPCLQFNHSRTNSLDPLENLLLRLQLSGLYERSKSVEEIDRVVGFVLVLGLAFEYMKSLEEEPFE